jgi:hypothetical protein
VIDYAGVGDEAIAALLHDALEDKPSIGSQSPTSMRIFGRFNRILENISAVLF